jgi:asparagine synthase (glutamine-hydrolysing)
VDPEYKRIDGETKPEKHALRALFDGEIPEPVLWRTKETQMPKTPTLNLKTPNLKP